MPYHMYPETPKLMGPIVTGDVHVFPPTKFTTCQKRPVVSFVKQLH